MVVEWEIVSAIVAIAVSLGTVFIAYGRQWSKLSILIDNLSKAVERLTILADNLAKEQANMAVQFEKLKAGIKSTTDRVTGIENRLDKVLCVGFKCHTERGDD